MVLPSDNFISLILKSWFEAKYCLEMSKFSKLLKKPKTLTNCIVRNYSFG